MITSVALPVLDETNAERIVAHLREDIVKLALRPGDPVSEAETAARFGVSRQPVREALIRLAQMGLVTVRARRATRVVPISEKAVLDARFVREALEVEIMRKAAAMAGPDWDETLLPLIAAQEEAVAANDPARFHALDEQFHQTVAELTGAGFVWELIDAQKAQLDRVRFMTVDSNLALSLAEHKAIVAAILTGDGAEAETVLRRHLGKITEHLARGRERFPTYFVPF